MKNDTSERALTGDDLSPDEQRYILRMRALEQWWSLLTEEERDLFASLTEAERLDFLKGARTPLNIN